MPTLPNESYADYHARVIDPISPSYCAAKWFNATIWLGSGMTTSCHHPLPHKVDAAALAANPKLLHNTPHKKAMRRMMLAGERPTECDYCWRVEDLKRGNISDRTFKTVLYSDADIQATRSMGDADVDLQTLEIAFDRTCNFACSYCNPAFSTTWVKDIRSHGPYAGLETDGREHYNHAHDGAQPFRVGDPNPYVEAFWHWWPDLAKSLKELRVTGGEPTMSADFWRLLDWFKDQGCTMRFAVNTNLGMKADLLDRLIDRSHAIPDFRVYTSNEACGAKAEYIRDGLVWEDWTAALHRLIDEGRIKALNMMMTINALSLFGLPDFLDWQLAVKEKYGRDFPVWSANILRFPSFQSPLVLPPSVREERRLVLVAWLERNGASPLLHEFERTQIERLIDYLDAAKTPHDGASDRVELERDFKRFYRQYDARRGKSFATAFPELASWFDGIAA